MSTLFNNTFYLNQLDWMYNHVFPNIQAQQTPSFSLPTATDPTSRDRNRERRRALQPLRIDPPQPVEYYTRPYPMGGSFDGWRMPMYLVDGVDVPLARPKAKPYMNEDEPADTEDRWWEVRADIVGCRNKTPAQRYKERYMLDLTVRQQDLREEVARGKSYSGTGRPVEQSPQLYAPHMGLPTDYPNAHHPMTPTLGEGTGYRHVYRQSDCLLRAHLHNFGPAPTTDSVDHIPQMWLSPEEYRVTMEAYANPRPLTCSSSTESDNGTSRSRTPELSASKRQSIHDWLWLLTPKSIKHAIPRPTESVNGTSRSSTPELSSVKRRSIHIWLWLLTPNSIDILRRDRSKRGKGEASPAGEWELEERHKHLVN